MKKITTLVALFCTILSFSQTFYRLDSLHIFNWSEADLEWNHNGRELYNYINPDTLATNVLRLISDDNGETWGNALQTNNAYNGNFLSESIQQTWDGAMWMDTSRDVYTYDSNDVLTLKENYINLGGPWQIFTDNTYTYNGNGDQISNTLRELDFVMLLLENKERWTYDYNGTLKERETKEVWNFADVWENDERCDYFYDSNDLLIRKEERGWTTSDEWSDVFNRTLFEYDSNDLPNIITNQNFATGVWVNTERTLNTFTNFNLTESIIQDWSSVDMDWENNVRLTQTYDANNNITEQVFQDWLTVEMEWENFLRQVYFWGDADGLSINEVLSENISVYPNPVVEKVKINFANELHYDANLTIFDVLGKKISKRFVKAGSRSVEMSMNNYKNGNYLLRITSPLGVETYKVIKH